MNYQQTLSAHTILNYIRSNNGYAPQSRYKVTIAGESTAVNDMIGHTCYTCSIPMVTQASYANVEMTFRCTIGNQKSRGGLPELRFFQSWIDKVCPKNTFKLGWKDNYARDIIIEYLNSELEPIHSTKLLRAYPTNLGAIELTHEGMEQAEFSVEFAYDTWI